MPHKEPLPRIRSTSTWTTKMRWFVAFVLCVATTGRTRADAPPIIDLGTLGGCCSSASAVNATGQVVGSAALSGTPYYSHAFSWTATGGIIDLGTLGGGNSNATAISANGQVVGASTVNASDAFPNRAFSWTQSGGMIDLGTLGGDFSYARAVNSSGVVVGDASRSDGAVHAFAWTATSGMADLGALGGSTSIAWAVNEAGQVVGSSSTPENATHAFLWTRESGMIDLTPDSCYGEAWGINAGGQVVGYVQACNGKTPPVTVDMSGRGFFWSPSDGLAVLPTFGGVSGQVAKWNGINDAAVVVGSADSPDGNRHAFMWTVIGGIVDLGLLPGGSWSSATGVNANGQVVGIAQSGSRYHPFVWSSADGMTDLGTLGGSYGPAAVVSTAGAAGFSFLSGDQELHATFWPLTPPADTTPPVVTVPSSVTVDATSPAGAAVTFSVSASDPDDAAGPVICAPASGSTFPIGTTNVTCTSTDTHANTGHASVTVTVLSPAQIVANLSATAAAVNFKQAGNLLANVLRALNGGQINAACGSLGAFINQVQAQAGKSLTAAHAGQLIGSATDARAALACR